MINNDRDMTVDFEFGLLDGAVKVLAPDRGGVVDPTSVSDRQRYLRNMYGLESNWPLQPSR